MEAAVAGRCGVMEIGPSMTAQEAMPALLRRSFRRGSLLWPYRAPVAS